MSDLLTIQLCSEPISTFNLKASIEWWMNGKGSRRPNYMTDKLGKITKAAEASAESTRLTETAASAADSSTDIDSRAESDYRDFGSIDEND